ncbi:ThiF family adenylyltransferase [Microbacterium sp.]|uniref:ThiF family adenylyltransferase n=1 Tax=Microbacterium sp. TaxID=51671 RepID=UPI001ACF3B4D|nr:ThiF family adenylyltransferase [Microbacterium sp.]MBN9158131.1 ThiF family adenylyltransferase [Microbacterium sp.]
MDDYTRLLDEGYDVQLIEGYLLVNDVPYVTAEKTVQRGSLIMPAALAGDTLTTPPDHTTHFGGAEPCDADGRALSKIINSAQHNEFLPGRPTDFYFSAKPPAGNYANYYDKVTTYVELVGRWALLIDPRATARTYPVREADTDDAPFVYRDSASSRAGVAGLNTVFTGLRIAIVGLGGTGSHILDLVAKTPVAEIHLYDGDVFLNHNAFRAPGAADVRDLRGQPNKAEYWAVQYSRLKRGITAHPVFFERGTVAEVSSFDFVFLALDDGSDREGIANALEEAGVAFIDVGMGITDTGSGLTGILRVSLSTPEARIHVPACGTTPDEYARNIQISDLNAVNAALAVIQWKRHLGFYADMASDISSFAYSVSDNLIAALTR